MNEKTLQSLAGEVYFDRGVGYYNAGTVAQLMIGNDNMTARVHGSMETPYLVRFWHDRQKLQWGCACPLGADGAFCKHLVAAGLTWINNDDSALHSEPDLENVASDLRAALAPFDRETLLEMIIQRAIWDEHLLEELHLLGKSQININKNK